MILTLEDDVFAGQVPPLLLLSIIRHGFEQRHIILTDPLISRGGGRQLDAWLKTRDELVREAVLTALRGSLGRLSSTASRVEVRVVAGRRQSHWEGRPPELTPADAALLLAMPLRLMVEDRLTDKYFLLCIAPGDTRKELERAFAQGWLRAEHGGGLGSMKRYVESLRSEPAEKLRIWLLFDSDQPSAAEPPSRDCLQLEEACKMAELRYHRLQRRSIESYLPLKALQWWAGLKRGGSSTDRQKLVREFAKMKERRFYDDMKARFGRDIAELFREEDFKIDPDWLRDDGVEAEATAIIQSLFERM